MQRNKLAALVGLIVVLAFGAVSVSAATKTTTIHIKGMHCKVCSGSVTKALESTEGVQKADVSFEKGEAVIQYDDQKVTEDKLRDVINSTGFKVVDAKAAPANK